MPLKQSRFSSSRFSSSRFSTSRFSTSRFSTARQRRLPYRRRLPRLPRAAVILRVCAVLWCGVIFFFSLHGGPASHAESRSVTQAVATFLSGHRLAPGQWVYDLYQPFVPDGNIDLEGVVRKSAHAFEYAVLGALCMLSAFAARGAGPRGWLPPAAGLAVSLVDEMVFQRFLAQGRTSSLLDVALDSLALTLAALLTLAAGVAAVEMKRRRERKRRTSFLHAVRRR